MSLLYNGRSHHPRGRHPPTEPTPGSAAVPIGSGAPDLPGDASVASATDRSSQPQHLNSTPNPRTNPARPRPRNLALRRVRAPRRGRRYRAGQQARPGWLARSIRVNALGGEDHSIPHRPPLRTARRRVPRRPRTAPLKTAALRKPVRRVNRRTPPSYWRRSPDLTSRTLRVRGSLDALGVGNHAGPQKKPGKARRVHQAASPPHLGGERQRHRPTWAASAKIAQIFMRADE